MVTKLTLAIFTLSVIYALFITSKTPEIKTISTQEFTGHVVSEQTRSSKAGSFFFETEQGDKFLVRTKKHFKYQVGDKLFINGLPEITENFTSKNGIEFDYKNYLMKDSVTHILAFPKIEIIQTADKKNIKFYIFSVKNLLVDKTKKIFDNETSPLVLGILLGLKDSISPDLEDNFRRTGLIHILVLSGFNLTIIAYFVFFVLKRVNRNLRYIFAMFFVFAFAIMVGAGATIIRASLMITIFILAKFFRRNSNPNNALILAGAFMIFQNPMILLYDPSFQLSFTATLGLVNFFPIIEKFYCTLVSRYAIPAISIVMPAKAGIFLDQPALKDIVVSNVAVQIFVAPLLIFMMGEISIISLIPNILVLPIIPFFMLVSFLAILLGFIPMGVHLPFVYVTEVLSDFMIFIVNFFGNLNFAVLKTGSISVPVLVSIYLILVGIIFFLFFRENSISKQKYNYLQ